MKLSATGIVINQSGELLVIKRDDTRTWAVPGGAVDAGELATDAAAREVEEESGFKVLPVRLVGVRYIPFRNDGYIEFMFRCLLRGGAPKTSTETLRVAYTPTRPLGVRMLRIHNDQLEQAIRHHGGAPFWSTFELSTQEQVAQSLLFNVFYPGRDLLRRVTGGKRYQNPSDWTLSANVLVRNADGGVRWITAASVHKTAPWEAAQIAATAAGVNVTLADLSGVYTTGQHVTFVFVGEVTDGSGEWQSAEALAATLSDSEQVQLADAADRNRNTTVFKHN